MVTADDNELDAFWDIAREHADLAGVPVFFGANPVRTLRPPAWAFGATPEQSDELLERVLDGEGHPRALVVTTEARVVPFDEVDADHARDEGEGDGSLEQWREAHERLFAEQAEGGFVPTMKVVLERFRVLYPST